MPGWLRKRIHGTTVAICQAVPHGAGKTRQEPSNPQHTTSQLSFQSREEQQWRTRKALERSAAAMSSLHALANSTPAKCTTGIRKSPSTDSHMSTLISAMVCAAMAQGPEWTTAQVLVDSGSEHPPLLSQKLAAFRWAGHLWVELLKLTVRSCLSVTWAQLTSLSMAS